MDLSSHQKPSLFRRVLFTIRRNTVSVGFPALVAYLIYTDYSRTQAYKTSQRLLATTQLKSKGM